MYNRKFIFKAPSIPVSYTHLDVYKRQGLSRTKTIPFTVETKGTPGKGYVLGSIDYEPKHIEITGAEDDLEKISSIKLANLDISDSTKSIEKTIKASDIKLPDGIAFVKSVDKIKNIVIRANIEKKTKRTLTIPTGPVSYTHLQVKSNPNCH